jgi:TolB-like protein
MEAKWIQRACLCAVFCVLAPRGHAQPESAMYPAAVLPFQERGDGAKGQGDLAADLLFSELAASPDMVLVERQDLDRVMSEFELAMSGIVSADDAADLGRLTGARILITGSVIEADQSVHLVAKIIGVETSRMLGESVNGPISEPLAPMVKTLAQKVVAAIRGRGSELVPAPVTPKDRIAALREQCGSSKRPSVSVRLNEHHIGRPAVDPAARTEIMMLLEALDFEVIATEGAGPIADIELRGEGFSELAIRRGNLVSVKARLELEAIDRETGRLIAADRQTEIAVDIAEHVAAKKALQNAAAAIAERMLPKLIKK